MKRIGLLALLLLSLGLVACGGGGGGGTPPPPASTACVWGSTNWDGCNWQ